MAQQLPTDYPIDPTVTSGTALADILNRSDEVFNSTNSGPTRPATIKTGGLWAKTGGAALELFMFDGTTDIPIQSGDFGVSTDAGNITTLGTDGLVMTDGTALDSKYVKIAGDTMTGALVVNVDSIIHGATVGRGAGAIASNTAMGSGALSSNTTGSNNTANGVNALYSNTTGSNNTANGIQALYSNTTGNFNTANGVNALYSNTTGSANTANGDSALLSNTEGFSNTANGYQALRNNTTGNYNTANGISALENNITGTDNVANGSGALFDNTTGSNNVGIGREAGRGNSPRTITTQNNEICIGNNDHTGAFIRIAFTVTSDARDKAALAPIPHGLDFVNALLPTEYQFKAGGRDGVADGHRRFGFLAQDVLAAEGENPVIINNDDPDSLKMTTDYLIPVLVNAMKELTEQVNTLKAEVATLKGN